MDRVNTGKRTGKKKVKKVTAKMQTHLIIVFTVIFLAVLLLAGRIIYLNIFKGESYGKKVLSQQSYVSSTLPYQRGTIYDSNGIILAKSEKVYNVILDCKVLLYDDNYLKVTLEALDKAFGIPGEEVTKVLMERPESQYYILRKHESVEKYQIFEALQRENTKIKGIWFEEEYIRTYPYSSLASHVIGYTNSGNSGSWGIEQYYNSLLNGTNGRIYGYYDAELNVKRTVKEADDGKDIISTINVPVQTIVEKHAKEFMNDTGCENIGIIMMNPNNGDIIAMVSNQGFDLNNPRDLSVAYTKEEISEMNSDEQLEALNKLWRNFCISDTYEPGSTYKTFTIAAALEEAVIGKDDTYYCSGSDIKGGWKINCNNKYGHGNLSLTGSLMKSCNCALMQIVEMEGPKIFFEYQHDFGFGRKTQIDLPGESKGILLNKDQLTESGLATSSFGQSFNVTMIQMISAYCSLVNGGNYYEPRIVAEILNPDGSVYDACEKVLRCKTISPSTSEFIKEALYATVESGTARPAQVDGYMVGGKTGTAQKGIREDKKYVVSFIGCVPALNPEVVIYVVIDEAQDEEKFNSSSLATKLTSEILSEVLPIMGIYPDGDINYDITFEEEYEIIDEINDGFIREGDAALAE